MIEIHWYLLTVFTLIVIASLWASVHNPIAQTNKERIQCFGSTAVNCAISIGAYWILVFILALVIAAGIWLFLLLLVWVPSDFFQNYFDSDVFAKALHNIKPAIYKSAASPGMTKIPLLDYISLYSAYVLSPWLGIWGILKQTPIQTTASSPQPQN